MAPEPRRRVIALWAVPRSVSTAFEKALSRHPQVGVVHEPFTDCYYFGRERRSSRYGLQPAKAGFDAAAAGRAIDAQRSPVVFVKDLAFQARPYVADDFLASVTNTFIVRHPAVVLRSLQQLKPDFTEDEFGFIALHGLWKRVHQLGHRRVVVEGDGFRADPVGVLRRYCAAVGVEFVPKMLSWSDVRIRVWDASEEQSQARWHRTLESSVGVIPPSPREAVDVPPQQRGSYDRALEVYMSIAADALGAGALAATA